MIEFIIKRSNRKSVAIHLTEGAQIEVRAPFGMPRADIDEFVNSKRNWIMKNLPKIQATVTQREEFELNYGDYLPICGKEFPIVARDSGYAGFDGKCFFIPPNCMSRDIKENIIAVYKSVAHKILDDKVAYYAKLMGVTPKCVKINSAKTRWGSCSKSNSLNFSWTVIMASNSEVNYVVVHELAHIREHNHSSRFWEVVKSVIPDYKESEKSLKQLHQKQLEQGWT